MKKYASLFCGIVAMSVLAALQPAQAQQSVETLTLSSGTVAAAVTGTVTSNAFWIRNNQGFSVTPAFALSGTGTANVTFNFAVSVDGTNWSTTTPISYAVAATGTSTVRGFANFGPTSSTTINNIRWVRLATIQNANTPGVVNLGSVIISRNNSD